MILPFLLWIEFAKRQHGEWSWLRVIGRAVPCGAAAVVYLVLRWLTLSPLGIQTGIIPGVGAGKLTGIYKIPAFWERVSDNLYIIPRYLLTIFRPTMFSLRYEVPGDFSPKALLLAAAWTIIIGTLLWAVGKGRSRMTLFGLFWFAAFYLPVSGVVMFPSAPMADRYLYLPAIGLWLVIADKTDRLILSGKHAARYGWIAVTVVLVLLSGLTVVRNRDWRNDISLFSRFVEQYPEDAYGHSGLGSAYYAAREKDIRYLDLAEAELLKSLEINPQIPGIHTTVGNIRLIRGDSEAALHYYTIALGIYPLDKEALLNRAITYENLDRGAEALEDFRRFLAIPGYELSDARPYAEARIQVLSK